MPNHKPCDHPSDEALPVIEGFRIIAKLGRGATSSVWKAEQVSLNREVVIKVLAERLTNEPENVALFKAEARIAANFKHTGIVQVYDFGQSSDSKCYYFVMEYISGYSVGDWIRRKGRIAEDEALVVTHAVADAMKYAWHLSGIVHCDIKPDNIMIDGDGTIKVADLGLAHTVKSMASHPNVGESEVVITGTPNYMAPEQVRGSEPIDCRTDIYALGSSLYHMVTGQLPFGESPPDLVMERQLKDAYEYPQKLNPDLSVSVTRLILKMTAKEPAERFQTWDEVLAEVIRLEREKRTPAAAVKKPAQAAVVSVPGKVAKSAGPARDNPRPDVDRKCPHCDRAVASQALYCGFCGKALNAPVQDAENRKQMTIRLKPIQKESSAGPRPAGVSPIPAAPKIKARRRQAWHVSFGNHVRMMLSLFLLIFLGYYTYQKVKYDRDVIIPIKAAFIRAVQPLLERGWSYIGEGLQRGAQWSNKFLWSRPAQPAESSDETEFGSEPETESGEDMESGETYLEAQDALMAEQDASQATTGDAALKPGSDGSALDARQQAEFDRLLALCKQHQPKPGDRIKITLDKERKEIELLVDHITAHGVMAKVSPGFVEYPFYLMKEQSRLMFFPEERARRILRNKMKKSQ